MNVPVRVFLSYSHQDDDLREELERHLSVLKRSGLIGVWCDRRIGPGEDFKHIITDELENADIILLLVSASFIASDFCWSIEMRRGMERHNTGQCVVIPIILHDVVWDETPFARLLALPKDGKAISSWNNRHEALADVVRQLRRMIRHQVESGTERTQRRSADIERDLSAVTGADGDSDDHPVCVATAPLYALLGFQSKSAILN